MASLGTIRTLSVCRQVPVKSIVWNPKRWAQGGGSQTTSSKANAPQDVPGLSKACILPTSGEVGPGASKAGTYKNPEYFSYHNKTYFEAEIEMSKYRLPQPSNKKSTK